MSLFFEISIVFIASIHTLIYLVDVLNRLEIYEEEEMPENVKHLYS